jgi:glycosyltransferase involved in cell wall biosynthesis
MKLGIVAPEFPPTIGGMQAVALGLARHLTPLCEVFVLARRSDYAYAEPYRVHPVLTGRIDQDRDQLQTYETDAWLFMNAGYAALANELSDPCFVYCHGNDFLTPRCIRTKYADLLPKLSKNQFSRRFVSLYRRILVWRDIRGGLRSVNLAFVNSNPMRRRLISRYRLNGDRIRVVHPGVDECFFQERVLRSDGIYRILTVTRFQSVTRRKNVDGMLRAVARIKDIPIEYTIVGEGDDRSRFENLARELGLGSRVRFLGAISGDDLLACYRENDLFLLAPRKKWNDVEGFGVVYLEASASGLPVLATRCGGITDAVRQGVTGELLKSADISSIEIGIRTMWKNRDKFEADKMREFARQFRWEKTAGRLYNQLMQSLQSV